MAAALDADLKIHHDRRQSRLPSGTLTHVLIIDAVKPLPT
jgi:hypothetical protein